MVPRCPFHSDTPLLVPGGSFALCDLGLSSHPGFWAPRQFLSSWVPSIPALGFWVLSAFSFPD